MDLHQAVESALLILDEETTRPTVDYDYVGEVWPRALAWQENEYRNADFTPASAGPEALNQMRRAREREVEENPTLWRFKSRNFELLVLLLHRLPEEQRSPFLKQLFVEALERSPLSKADRFSDAHGWGGYTSGLTLLLEFGVRTRQLDLLCECLDGVTKPSAGVAILLRQLAETIALNFTIFSESEIVALPQRLQRLKAVAARQSNWFTVPNEGEPPIGNVEYVPGSEFEAQEIVQIIDAIAGQCKQAQYFYLKGALEQTANLEVENDKAKVLAFLDALGFEPHLQAALLKAEALYANGTDIFDLKSCLGLLRSFLEEMHSDACKAIAAANPALSVQTEWGNIVTFLRKNGFLTAQEEKLLTGLYAVISDQGVHPLIAEREYGRLIRNMVIEYGLVFLSVVSKKGVSIKAANP